LDGTGRVTPELAAGLTAVAAAMADTPDDWWIIGSAAVALHGGTPLTVADIDVLTSRATALRLADLWSATPDPPGDSALFRSAVHFEHRLGGATVDVMAELEVGGPGGWTLLQPRSRIAIAVGGVTLYAPDRAELIEILGRFGRPKDLERAALLRARVVSTHAERDVS
jgi:hypothetical protein